MLTLLDVLDLLYNFLLILHRILNQMKHLFPVFSSQFLLRPIHCLIKLSFILLKHFFSRKYVYCPWTSLLLAFTLTQPLLFQNLSGLYFIETWFYLFNAPRFAYFAVVYCFKLQVVTVDFINLVYYHFSEDVTSTFSVFFLLTDCP